jgi:hypothetical protein
MMTLKNTNLWMLPLMFILSFGASGHKLMGKRNTGGDRLD